jgi:hypothetical protein
MAYGENLGVEMDLERIAAADPESHEQTSSELQTSQLLTLLWFATLDCVVHPEQLVKGLLLTGSLFVLYGESNSGKTFILVDLALTIAASLDWRGRRTRRGLVIYVAGEGAASVRARVTAWRIAHPQISADLPFAIVPQAVDFLDRPSIEQLIATIQAAEIQCGEKAALIVIDTFARAIPGGNESDARDVGIAVMAADQIRVATGAAVAFVHHAGKDPTKGARGSSALRAAADTEMFVEGLSGTRTITVTKQRDLESGQSMAFNLVPVEIGTDPEDGSSITSCVVEHVQAQQVPQTAKTVALRGKRQRELLVEMRKRAGGDSARIWTLEELRGVARDIGMKKGSARSAVDGITLSPYMTQTIGGYRFTDGGGLKG